MSGYSRPLTTDEIASVEDGDIEFDEIPELDADFRREAEPARPDFPPGPPLRRS